MSCVAPEIFRHTNVISSYNAETECDCSYSTTQTLRTYSQDTRFYVAGEYRSQRQGAVSTNISLSTGEAKRLRKQLDEFLALNS